MVDNLVEAIDEGRIGPRDDSKARSKILFKKFGQDKDLAKKIYYFGLKTTSNMVTDMHKGVQYLNEIKDSVKAQTKKYNTNTNITVCCNSTKFNKFFTLSYKTL